MNNVMTLTDPITNNNINISVEGDSIVKSVDIVFGKDGGKVITFEELSDPAKLPAEFLAAVSGTDADGVISIFTNATSDNVIADTDKIPFVNVGDGTNESINNIPFGSFKTELKTYFDTQYAGKNADGTTVGSSAAPVISGPDIGNETATIVLTVDNYNTSSIYTFDVSGGSFSRSGGVVTWLLPQVTDSTAHKLTVTVTDAGKTPTTVFHSVNVFNINTTVDSMVLYEGSTLSEFSNLYNMSVVASRLLATGDTILTVANNKIATIPTMESGDKILVDGITYEISSFALGEDGASNTSLLSAVPVLTSNTSSTLGTAICSNAYSGHAAFNSFNMGNIANSWITNSFAGTDYLGFNFIAPIVINKYTMIGNGYDKVSSPKSWILQASNDGTTWVNLDTRLNQPVWVNSESRTYTFLNSVPYKIYRVYITANQGGVYAQIGYLSLIQQGTVISATLPVLPQFITAAKLLTKFAETNTITQDTYETDFTGVSGLTAVYEQYNLITAGATVTSIPTVSANVGDIIILGNSADGVKTLELTTSNYTNGVIDISSLGFATVPTYGYRKDAKLQVGIGSNSFVADNRVDTILSSPLFIGDGAQNTSTINAIPLLTTDTPALTNSALYNATYPAWHIADGVLVDTASTCLIQVAAGAPAWLKYDFSRPIVINKYGINSRVNWSAPTAWTLQASDDNINFVILDTRVNIVYTATAETKWFTFNNAKGYRYYKLVITAPIASYVDITELILVENNSSKMQIKTVYDDIITGNSARTLKFRVKLNQIGDAVEKISGTIEKL